MDRCRFVRTDCPARAEGAPHGSSASEGELSKRPQLTVSCAQEVFLPHEACSAEVAGVSRASDAGTTRSVSISFRPGSVQYVAVRKRGTVRLEHAEASGCQCTYVPVSKECRHRAKYARSRRRFYTAAQNISGATWPRASCPLYSASGHQAFTAGNADSMCAVIKRVTHRHLEDSFGCRCRHAPAPRYSVAQFHLFI